MRIEILPFQRRLCGLYFGLCMLCALCCCLGLFPGLLGLLQRRVALCCHTGQAVAQGLCLGLARFQLCAQRLDVIPRGLVRFCRFLRRLYVL